MTEIRSSPGLDSTTDAASDAADVARSRATPPQSVEAEDYPNKHQDKPNAKYSDKRTAIYTAALNLFATRGFSNTPVSLIAKQAGVSQGLMYRYFDSKEALLQEIIWEALRTVEALWQQDDLEAIVRASFDTVRDDDFWPKFYSLRNQPDVIQLVADDIQQMNTRILATITQMLVKLDIPHADTEARLLFASIDGVAQHLVSISDYPISDVVDALMTRYKPQQRQPQQSQPQQSQPQLEDALERNKQ
ncbi:MAG: TetR/AcrR family transcriptional regulator [Deinococcota bacterium]